MHRSLSAIEPSLLLLPVLGVLEQFNSLLRLRQHCHVRTLYRCFSKSPLCFLFRRFFLWLLLQLL